MSVAYPNTKQSFGIIGFIFLAMLVFTPIVILYGDRNESLVSMIYYLCVFLSISIIFYRRKRFFEKKDSILLGPNNIIIYLILIVTTISLQFGVGMPITELIPMNDYFKELFAELSESMTNIWGFISAVILAPLLEEFIFRGIILNGLLKKVSPIKAILLSSFLFAFVHLNPWQFVSAFLIGLIMGWVYFKTGNLLYAIFIHFTNNFLASLAAINMNDMPIDTTMAEMLGSTSKMIMVVVGSIVLLMVSLYLLKRQFTAEPFYSLKWESTELETKNPID